MKFRGFVLFVLLAAVLLVAAYYPPKVDNAQKEAILMQTILAGLKQLHYDPIELDDTGARNDDTKAGVLKINKFLEARIKEKPENWFWVHRRWPKPLYKKT